MCCQKASCASAATDCCPIATVNNCCRWHERCSLNRDAILCSGCSCLTAHHGTAPAAEKPCASLSATPQQNSTSQASIPHDHCCQPAPPTCSSHVYPEVCLPPNQHPHPHAPWRL